MPSTLLPGPSTLKSISEELMVTVPKRLGTRSMTFSLLHPRSGKRTARLVRVQGLCAFMGYLAGCRFDGMGGYIDMVTPMGRARERDDLGILFALDPAIMPAQVCWPKTGTRRLRSSRDGGRGEASTLGTRFAMCVSCSGSPGQHPQCHHRALRVPDSCRNDEAHQSRHWLPFV
jgi:hypothetical protein